MGCEGGNQTIEPHTVSKVMRFYPAYSLFSIKIIDRSKSHYFSYEIVRFSLNGHNIFAISALGGSREKYIIAKNEVSEEF